MKMEVSRMKGLNVTRDSLLLNAHEGKTMRRSPRGLASFESGVTRARSTTARPRVSLTSPRRSRVASHNSERVRYRHRIEKNGSKFSRILASDRDRNTAPFLRARRVLVSYRKSRESTFFSFFFNLFSVFLSHIYHNILI